MSAEVEDARSRPKTVPSKERPFGRNVPVVMVPSFPQGISQLDRKFNIPVTMMDNTTLVGSQSVLKAPPLKTGPEPPRDEAFCQALQHATSLE